MGERDGAEVEEQFKSTLGDATGYYKWMASLAVITGMLSMGAVSIFGDELVFRWLFILGWTCLAICVLANIIVVNKALALGSVWAVPFNERTDYQREHIDSKFTRRVMEVAAWVQQWAFLVGGSLVFIAFTWNLISSSDLDELGLSASRLTFAGLSIDMLGFGVLIVTEIMYRQEVFIEKTMDDLGSQDALDVIQRNIDTERRRRRNQCIGFSVVFVGFLVQAIAVV